MINCGGDGHVSTMSDVPLGLQLWAMAVLICYYHQGQLSIQKLWFYIQPCMRTMEILSLVAVAIDKVGKFCILLFIHMWRNNMHAPPLSEKKKITFGTSWLWCFLIFNFPSSWANQRYKAKHFHWMFCPVPISVTNNTIYSTFTHNDIQCLYLISF